MKKESTQAETVLEAQSPNKLRRSKSREVSSRLQNSQLSPTHRKPKNKNRLEEGPTSVSLQTLWPYSSPSSTPTFSDHSKPRHERNAKENRSPISVSALQRKSDRRASDGLTEARKRGVEVASRYMAERSPRPPIGGNESLTGFRRARSMSLSGASESARTQWVSSPGRSATKCLSPYRFTSGASVSQEKLVNSGFSYLKSKKSNCVSETVHDFRLLHNRLVQWRFVNARADLVNVKLAKRAQCNVVCVWNGFEKLRHSVVEKRIQLQREKIEMKLNTLLQSQCNLLQIWENMENQHSSTLTMAIESLNSVACKVPLVEGAEVETRSCCLAIEQALDFASSLESVLKIYSLEAEENVDLLLNLAKVVSHEKLLLHECVEILRPMSFLEIEEWSLRCGITQICSRPKQGT